MSASRAADLGSILAYSVALFFHVEFRQTWGRYHGGRRPSKWRQSNRHSTIGTRQTECQEALPSSANVQSHLTSSFADDGNASWYSVCRVSMVEWRLDCENCRHLTVVGFHDTGPWVQFSLTAWHFFFFFFPHVESRQWVTNWYFSGYPACESQTGTSAATQPSAWRLQDRLCDWLARYQHTVIGYDKKLSLQLLSHSGSAHNCLSRSVPEIHWHVART